MSAAVTSPQSLSECLPEDSWFREYLDIWPLAESPKSYLLFTAMSLLGACYGRKVFYDHLHMKLYPMLNLLLIGPSGVGKSTGAGFGFNTLWNLPKDEQPQVVAGATTVEKLHDDLFTNPRAILFASELANFFTKKKYMEDLIPYVTELLDYKPFQERRTKSGGLIIIPEPSVTVIGCSTGKWLREMLPDSATTGGFLARFLIVSEEFKAQRVALPAWSMSPSARADLERRKLAVQAEFSDLLHLHTGKIDFRDYESANVYAHWYSVHKPLTGHLEPFAQRAGEFVLRMSMLIALSCRRTEILGEDVKAALTLYGYIEGKLQDVVVSFTQQGELQRLVLEAVGDGELADKQIFRAMRNFCTSLETLKLIQSLEMSEDLLRLPNGHFTRRR